MLQNMRKYTHGWVATVLGVLLSLAFVMWGVENYLHGSSKKNLAAKVNGAEISANELNANYQRMILKLKQQAGESFALSTTMQQQVKSQLLNDIILQTVLVQAASKAGFMITPIQTVAIIKQMPQFQENGNFSKIRFEQIIERMSYNRAAFLADVSQTLLLNQVASGVIGSSFVMQNELNQSIALIEQKRDIEYAIIPSNQFKKPVVAVAIKQYYDQHLNEFQAPQSIQLEYVQLSADDLKKKIQISPQELNDYLSSSSNDAKEIKQAKEVLLQQKVEQEFSNLSEKLADLTYTNPNSLIEAANSLDLKVMTTDHFPQQGGKTALTKHPKILNTVFSPDFIKGNTNSNLIELAPGTVVVVRLKNYQPASPLPLTNVTTKIQQKLALQEANLKAQQKGEQMLTQLDAKNFNNVVTKSGLTISAKQKIARNQAGLDKGLLQLAFSISPKSGKKVAGAAMSNGDYLLVAVKNIIDLPANKITAQQRNNFSRVYADLYGKSEYELYIQNQMNKAKIKLSSS